MKLLTDSFWRAALYCLHPKVIALSLLPLLLMAGLAFGLGYFFWEGAIDLVRAQFEAWDLLQSLRLWMDKMGLSSMWTALAPLVVVLLITPLIVVGSLLLVVAMMSPAMTELVAKRRFPDLERKRGGSLAAGAFLALFSTLFALLALVLSIPLWLIPPLVLIVPPLIWGWLTYRVMSYDALAEHASRDERLALIRQHRPALLGMGILTGYLGAAPTLVFASGALFVLFAPVLVPLAIWIYTLVFAFSALWFSHFTLAALAQWRREHPTAIEPTAPVVASPQTPPLGSNTPELLPPP